MISKNPNPVNEFSPELWSHLKSTLEKAAREAKGPRIAAFDADGTLWDADAGETFFDWEIHHAGLKGLPADSWAHYRALKSPDPRVAYVWLAQINEGHRLEDVRKWAAQCLQAHQPWPVFHSQRKLIELLKSLKFEIYIVTASIKWAVEPAAGLLGIDHDHVIGIETKVENGVVTREGVLPYTWREGKALGLLKATGGVHPILACGNTHGDSALIESATHVQLTVATQEKPGGLFEEEEKLRTEAAQRGWLRHHFRA
jgi:phosphoserine phosphatase